MKMKEYIKDVISNTDTTSSRKFVTLIIAAHFILASFVILFFAFYVIVWAPKGKTDIDLLKTLQLVMQYDFYIILSGLGFITSSDLVRVIISKGFNPNPVITQIATEGDIKTEVSQPTADPDTSDDIKMDDTTKPTTKTSYD